MAEAALVTGGAGFIGSHLVEALVRRGDRVRVLDDLSTGKRQNLRSVAQDVELVEGDVRDEGDCRRAAEGCSRVFHLAALGSVPRSVEDPVNTDAVNVRGTLNMLMAARNAGAQRFVFSSSSSVYGDTPALPKVETMRPHPQSPYAVSKLAGEEYGRAFASVYGLPVVSLRYFNVFGPRQDPGSQYAAVIPRFIAALLSGEQPVVYGDGLQSRDFTYVANVAEANLQAAEARGVEGQVFNIACGERFTLLELLAELASILGVPAQPVHKEPRAGDVRHSLADIRAACAKLGAGPKVGFGEGLRRTVGAWT